MPTPKMSNSVEEEREKREKRREGDSAQMIGDRRIKNSICEPGDKFKRGSISLKQFDGRDAR